MPKDEAEKQRREIESKLGHKSRHVSMKLWNGAQHLKLISVAKRDAVEVGVDLGEDIRVGITLGHAKPDPTYGDVNLCANFE